jgi:chitinase
VLEYWQPSYTSSYLKCGLWTTKAEDSYYIRHYPEVSCCAHPICNFSGQYGTTSAFCDIAGDGTPEHVNSGTAECLSNCGKETVNTDVGPTSYRNIAYFEAWNGKRPCLYMDGTDINTTTHTHTHFSFLDLTTSYGVSTANVQEQWSKSLKMSGVHRVAAFGGWAASTEPSTYWIFLERVKPANRDTLASNIAKFILDNKLDGVYID